MVREIVTNAADLELLETCIRNRVSIQALTRMYSCTRDELQGYVVERIPRLSNMLSQCPSKREKHCMRVDDNYPPMRRF